MTRLACVHAQRFVDADGGVEPNKFIPTVTVDLRVYYPPVEDNWEAALYALSAAYLDARKQLMSRFAGGEPHV